MLRAQIILRQAFARMASTVKVGDKLPSIAVFEGTPAGKVGPRVWLCHTQSLINCGVMCAICEGFSDQSSTSPHTSRGVSVLRDQRLSVLVYSEH